jgi:translation initiation factor 1A
MPNKQGGKNYKKAKKGNTETKVEEPLATEEFHRYAQVEKKLGGSRLLVKCSDGIIRQGIIRGKMHKKVWMNPSDVILVEINPELNQSHKSQECYIVHKYSVNGAQNLKSQGEIDFDVKSGDDVENDIRFGDYEEEEEDIHDKVDKITKEETKETKDKETLKKIQKEKSRVTEKQRQHDRVKKERGYFDIDKEVPKESINIDDI